MEERRDEVEEVGEKLKKGGVCRDVIPITSRPTGRLADTNRGPKEETKSRNHTAHASQQQAYKT